MVLYSGPAGPEAKLGRSANVRNYLLEIEMLQDENEPAPDPAPGREIRWSIMFIKTMTLWVVLCGSLMKWLPNPWNFWALYFGIIAVLVGLVVDVFIIGPRQMRRLQRSRNQLEKLVKELEQRED